MATNAKLPPLPSANGIITGPPKGVVGGNRKKQKRRANQAAKASAHTLAAASATGQTADLDYDEDPLGYGEEDDDEYSDPEHFHEQYMPAHVGSNGYDMPSALSGKKKNKKKKKTGAVHDHSTYNPELLGNSTPPIPAPAAGMSTAMQKGSRGNIWNTSTQQERQNIKDFWLSLSEDERKSLLKIEKEAVLRKMKQQQKHSCSCTVCGRKRTAIEEELEVLYEGYYEELEQYAHHDHPPLPSTDGMMPDPLQHRRPHPLAAPLPDPHLHPHSHSHLHVHNHTHTHTHAHSHTHPHHKTSQLQEHFDEDDFSDEEEEYSEDEYSDEEVEPIPRGGVQDFFNFGQNLTVKGILTPWLEKLQSGLKGNADNLLTVADDLLKNDGRKFIEMMEQLAERRMARESEAEYAAANPSHPGAYPPGDGYSHEDPLTGADEFDDDEASYDSQEDYDDDLEDEDEMGGLTEEQRMQEGRRMFQIFAARMFEQRVLTAYKEKVAAERQKKLLEELEDETKLEAQREAKKQRDAQKKKEKKKQQQQAKAEEKAKKDAEKAAEEARIREAEEKKQEEQRRKKEEQRKKKEDEKRKIEEERAKKEADKLRRQQEEAARREEAERKAREQKASERAKKDAQKKQEREEREAREKQDRERKSQEKEKRDRELKAKADKEAKEREKTAQQASQPPSQNQHSLTKRASQPGIVALPKQTAVAAMPSPHPSIATPAVPKAPTPAKQRQASQQGSLASSPKQTQSQISSAPSKSSSPNSVNFAHFQQSSGTSKTIMQKAGNQQPGPHTSHPVQSTSPHLHQQMQPPPGMPMPQQNPAGFGGMQPLGFQGFQGHQNPMLHGNMGHRNQMPIYGHQGPPMGIQSRFGVPGMNGMPGPPPGMMQPQGRGIGFPFDAPGAGQPPPGFGQPPGVLQQSNQASSIGPSVATPSKETPMSGFSTHSRQQSASEKIDPAATQPISRPPAPIQRPSSVKPHEANEVDEIASHLGSSALLEDTDEPFAEIRRQSGAPMAPRNSQGGGIGPIGSFAAPAGSFGAPGGSWPTPGLPFGQSPSLAQQNWGSLPPTGMSGWSSTNTAFPSTTGFGVIGANPVPRAKPGARAPTLRLALCTACQQLGIDDYHPIDQLLRQISAIETIHPPPSLREIEAICETEANSHNGGGELHIRPIDNTSFAVKWVADARTPDLQGRALPGLGEIGSPMPLKASPHAAAFGAPGMGRAVSGTQSQGGLGGLGTLGSPSF